MSRPVSINTNDGFYQHGKAFDLLKKDIKRTYNQLMSENNGNRPNTSEVARQAKVSRWMVFKIEQEILTENRVVSPEEKKSNRPVGPGVHTINSYDSFALLSLMNTNPRRSLGDYQKRLFEWTGTIVSESTISRFFKDGFDIKGNFMKPDLIPIDKFRPENIADAEEFLRFMIRQDMRKVKFGDEKHLRGAELFCKTTRRNVLTGVVAPVLTTSDFRNTHTIIGFCGIDLRTPPVYNYIHDGTNDAQSFSDTLVRGIVLGFFLMYTIIVLDNATIHGAGDNRHLVEWCWETHKILILFLPTRAPELNPQENVWGTSIKRMQSLPEEIKTAIKSNTAAYCADYVLTHTFTHLDICNYYVKSGYIAANN